MTKFSLVSFLITAAIATGLAWSIQHQLEQNALKQAAESAADQVSTILNPNLQPSDLNGPFDPVKYTQIDALIRQNVLREHIVRVKIWGSDGLLLYSDAKELVGQRFPVDDGLAEALAGKIAMDVSDLAKAENVQERGRFDRLFEVYIPMRPTGSTRIAGAYEIYYASAVLEPSLAEMRRWVWASVGLGFVILYGSLFTLVRNASGELTRRNDENLRLYTEVKQRLAEVEQADAQRRTSEARFANVLDIAADAIITVDETQGVLQFNEGAAQMFGYPAGEVLGQPLDRLLPPRFADVHRQPIHDFATTSETARRMGERLEVFGRRKDGGEFPAEASISKLVQEGQTTFTVILRDITERKQAEDLILSQLETLNALYATAQKLTQSLDLQELAEDVVRTCVEAFGARLAWLGRAEPDGRILSLACFPSQVSYHARLQRVGTSRLKGKTLADAPSAAASRL